MGQRSNQKGQRCNQKSHHRHHSDSSSSSSSKHHSSKHCKKNKYVKGDLIVKGKVTACETEIRGDLTVLGCAKTKCLEVREGPNTFAGTSTFNGPVVINSTLNVTGATIAGRTTYPIKQSDFATGSLRIKTPGTYVFTENVIFNAPFGPAATRPDAPLTGFWFAGISIECDNVVINGNGYTFTSSSTYVNANNTGTFAMVLLGNNQFSGQLFGAGGLSQYADTSSYLAANQVLVENINIIGAGSHFGIMGNNNNNIYINNCNISDCQVSSVFLQGAHILEITNCNFSGSTTPPPVPAAQATLVSVRRQLANFITLGVPGAAAQLAALNAYVLANPSRFAPSGQTFPTSVYGIFLVPGPPAGFPFPMNTASIAFATSFASGRNNENALIENCNFTGFKTDFNELVGVGTNIPFSPNFPVPVFLLGVFFGLFGTIEWKDVFPSGTFAPNDYTKAIAFCMYVAYPVLPPQIQALVPANSVAILDSIINTNLTEFNNNCAPIVSLQSDLSYAKGLFGIRAIATNNLTINNVKMIDFKATGILPIVPSTLPGYGALSAPQALTTSFGNTLWGISLEVCNNITTTNLDFSDFVSTNGTVFAHHLSQENANVTVSNSTFQNMSTLRAASRVFAVSVQNSTGGVNLQNLISRGLTAITPGNVIPYTQPLTVSTTVSGNQSFPIGTTTSVDQLLTTASFVLTVANTAGFPSTGALLVGTILVPRLVTYAGIVGNTFTGCSAANGSVFSPNGSSVQLSILNVASTTGFSSTGIVNVQTTTAGILSIAYNSLTATSFRGFTISTPFTTNNAASVTQGGLSLINGLVF